MDFLRRIALRANICSPEAQVMKPCLKEPSSLKANPSLADFPTSDSLPGLPELASPAFGRIDSKSSLSSSADPEEEPETPWKSSLHADITACIWEAAAAEERPEHLEFVKVLQPASRNKGQVELMRSVETGHFVAVKRMPMSWATSGHQEFLWQHHGEHEMPWVDVGLVKYLSSQGAPFLCNTLGVFMDQTDLLVVSAFADHGDLFDWCQRGHYPGPDREMAVRPIAQQMRSAVRYLHKRDIAHCDLSLENFLLAGTGASDGRLEVKLIDFSMAALGRENLVGARGKPSYEAPEMHQGQSHDPFRADVFALGVCLFLLASGNYPWKSTRPRCCPRFELARKKGFRAYLKRRAVRSKAKGDHTSQVHSGALIQLLEGLLQVQPLERAGLESPLWQWLWQEVQPIECASLESSWWQWLSQDWQASSPGRPRQENACLTGFMSWVQADS
eukprot:TRINITY_DN24060_c0_g2_i1.p1 TRINITY_DN24060_c0_g2~~TRINITY_DN24060_c0_g2_i1.p1  ORF type:complete len:455 (+),score=64.46 TRINITY_DN24060_c0_g2_i1:28-1365(+)